MRRILSVLCLLAMLVGVLAACDVHEHVFDTEKWTFDDDFHWHACTVVDGCSEQSDKAAHDFEVTVDEEGKTVNRCKVCGATNDKVPTAPEHEHTFDDKLATSDNFHWYACTVEGCYEMKDKAEHAFGNPEVTYTDSKITIKYVCVDCAFEKIEEQEVKTEVDDALSWDDAFKNFKLTNFTLDIYLTYGGETQNNHCVVTEKDAYYCIPGSMEFYTVPAGDGTYKTYQRSGNSEVFTLLNDTSNEFLQGAQSETVLQISFEQNFDKFTYDEKTASYVCTDVIEAITYDFDGSVLDTLYCYDSVVKLADGKISYIEAHYYFDENDDYQYSFRYYNIGISAVEVPQSVIDNAIPQTEDDVGGDYEDNYEDNYENGNYEENVGENQASGNAVAQ